MIRLLIGGLFFIALGLILIFWRESMISILGKSDNTKKEYPDEVRKQKLVIGGISAIVIGIIIIFQALFDS